MKAVPTLKPTKSLHPEKVLASFYQRYPPGTARIALWKWVIVTAKKNFSDLSDRSQEEFTEFFDALQDLIEAGYLLSSTYNRQSKEAQEP